MSAGRTREQWQRSNHRLVAENRQLRAALKEADAVLALCRTERRAVEPDDEIVEEAARRAGGFGCLMNAASRRWALMFDGTPQAGAQYTSGPTESTVRHTLALIRKALARPERSSGGDDA